MITNLSQNPLETIFYIISLIIAITIHEFAHAWTAVYLGDPTPEKQGRLSINPLRHLDFLGTIFLFIAGFGWGKPVYTNPTNYQNPKIGYAITSLAGPAANLIMAILFSLPYTIAQVFHFSTQGIAFFNFTELAYSANILLLIFNILPIYPLDGSKLIMAYIQNQNFLQNYIKYGPAVLILLLVINPWFPIMSWILVFLSYAINFIIRGFFLNLL
jgi:Zn-dependent protease